MNAFSCLCYYCGSPVYCGHHLLLNRVAIIQISETDYCTWYTGIYTGARYMALHCCVVSLDLVWAASFTAIWGGGGGGVGPVY